MLRSSNYYDYYLLPINFILTKEPAAKLVGQHFNWVISSYTLQAKLHQRTINGIKNVPLIANELEASLYQHKYKIRLASTFLFIYLFRYLYPNFIQHGIGVSGLNHLMTTVIVGRVKVGYGF